MASETAVSPDIARDTAASGSDQMIRWTTTVAVVVLGAIAAVISYRHMFILVSAYGEARWTAALLPISVDGMIVSSSMSLLADSRLGRRGGALPWTLLVIGSTASLAANVAVAEPSVVGRLVAAWPSAALIGSYELLMRQIRHASGPATSLGRTREPATSTVRKPQMVASAQEAPTDQVQTDEQVKDVRALPEQNRAPGQDQSHSGTPRGLTGLRYEAWNWALANRMGDGTLPPGRVIAERFGRSERWGRLVKRAGGGPVGEQHVTVELLSRETAVRPSTASSPMSRPSAASTDGGSAGSWGAARRDVRLADTAWRRWNTARGLARPCGLSDSVRSFVSTLGGFIWSIADQLRGPYRPNQYGNVILPFTILRRLDCILEPDRETVRALAAKYENPNRLRIAVDQATGRPFYNTSKYGFANLLQDADGLEDNLVDYIDRFSADVDVFEYFDFKKEIIALEKAGLLREIVKSFGAVDLHPDVVSNADMGDAFEYIIRKFNEAANETSGDHYTPRDAIRLLVDLLFAEKGADLNKAGIVRALYDPTAGTGGMLALAEEHLLVRNPKAQLNLYGQEYNPQSYAICKSDLIAKGHDASRIAFGNTLTNDAFKGKKFDFCMSNPPYGVDWKQYAKQVTKERDEAGPYGRFAPGLPATSDGQMLFLLHLVHKMRAPEDGGGRAGIVMNGSPLFNGGAESGPSNIRKWLLENDLVDAIVALPTNMFFNTGIATYIWILDNTKHPDRKGLVQLIDGTSFWTKMRKNLGSKGREISDANRAEVVRLYTDFTDADPELSKVLRNDEFGYWTITVERPLLDEDGKPVVDRKGKPKPDSKKRDTENVPFTYGGSTVGSAAAREVIQTYFDAEVKPHVPDAWIDWLKTKIGYEIPFTRHFYKYVPPRPLAEIDADLEKQVTKILDLLREVEA